MVGQGQFTRKDFLDAIFAQYYREHRGFIIVRVAKSHESKVSTRYFPNIDVLGREVYGDDCDVYFGICPRERMKPEKEHVKFILAIWGDIEIGSDAPDKARQFYPGPEQAAQAIRDFPFPPSITVNSGRGLHLYWLLDRVTEVADPVAVEETIRKVQAQLNCRMNPSLDALMRLPDTFDNKLAGALSPCRVKFINVNFRYSLEDFRRMTEAGVATLKKTHMRFEAETLTGPHLAEIGRPEATSTVSTRIPDKLETVGDQATVTAGHDVRSKRLAETSFATENVAESTQRGAHTATSTNVLPTTFLGQTSPVPELYADAGTTQDVFFSRLIAKGTIVEIALKKTDEIMKGKIEWVGREWLGVRDGAHCYAIPVGSISFIRHKE